MSQTGMVMHWRRNPGRGAGSSMLVNGIGAVATGLTTCAVLVAIGWAWNSFFVINKALWTSSYVLFTGGLALQFLSLCYWVIDIKGYRRWAKPFEVYGLNAIALYVVADVIAMALGVLKVGGEPLGSWIYTHLFASWASPINASLAMAIAFVLVCLALMWILYRRKIFLKV